MTHRRAWAACSAAVIHFLTQWILTSARTLALISRISCDIARRAAGRRLLSASAASRAPVTLPDLSYDYGELEPAISGEIMKIHHTKHHQVYLCIEEAPRGTLANIMSRRNATLTPCLRDEKQSDVGFSLCPAPARAILIAMISLCDGNPCCSGDFALKCRGAVSLVHSLLPYPGPPASEVVAWVK